MRAYLLVLLYAAIPAAGNWVGGAIAELWHVSRRTLGLALHAAAGIVLAVIGLELMPEALTADAAWIPIAAFVAGGAFFVAADAAVGRLALRKGGEAGALAIFFGVAMDLFSDGLMIGTGAVLDPRLGLLLAVGQMPADIPEGFASIATLRAAGTPRRQRIALTAALAVPIVLGASIGYWALRGAPELVTLSLLAFTGGVLTSVVVEEIVPEAHDVEDARGAALVLVAGFALFALIAAYLG